jgi:predicted AAA+ superfamily ATPase
LAAQGGYPESLEMDSRERRKWYLSYLDDLLVKDIRDVTEIRKMDVMRGIAEWLLAYSSKFFEISELSAKIGVSKETVESYLSTLKALYLFDEVRPWTKSDYSKIGKRSKYYAADTGLISNILGWSENSIYMNDDRSGK